MLESRRILAVVIGFEQGHFFVGSRLWCAQRVSGIKKSAAFSISNC
jgi:hypothetical protein